MSSVTDLERLARHVKTLLALRKRQAALSGKDYSGMTARAVQTHSANLTWVGMDIDKAEREAHAAAVDCGISPAKSAGEYARIDYYPSPLHHYSYQPTRPRCRQ